MIYLTFKNRENIILLGISCTLSAICTGVFISEIVISGHVGLGGYVDLQKEF